MHPYIHLVVQPIPYSRSLLYPLIIKNTAFLQWYQTLTKFDEIYRHTHRSPALTYNYSYRYQTQPILRDLHINPTTDTITCSMSLLHNKHIYTESIRHKVHYVPLNMAHSWSSPNGLDYIIQTEHAVKLDGELIHYDEIDKELIDKLHL
jgi:hypothetical protein